MLKTLMKHDVLPTYKRPLQTFIALLIASAVLPFLINWMFTVENTFFSVISVFCIMALIGIYIGAFIVTLLALQKLLFDSFYKPQGYLTFTLPFSLKKILFSKILVSFIYLIAYFIVMTLGISIIVLELPLLFGEFSYRDIFSIVDVIYNIGNNFGTIVLYLLRSFGVCLFLLILLPLSGALSHSKLTKKNSDRKATFVAILIWFLSSFVFSLIISPINFVDTLSVQIVGAIYYLTLGIGGFFLTAYLMDYKIDVE